MKVIKSPHSTTIWFTWSAQQLIWEKIFAIGDKITTLIMEEDKSIKAPTDLTARLNGSVK